VTAAVRRLIVSVADLDAALALYRDVLGLEPTGAQGELAFLRTADGLEVMLHRRATVASPAAVAIGFLVDDLDAVVERWRSAGGGVIDPPATQPWGERMAVVQDADGHVVCISAR
jgi:predicted enzyme related to lactoylglutathione lyase